eukprot:m51a1_g245 putative silent information regulator family protein (490) ;mRNA; r:149121-150645
MPQERIRLGRGQRQLTGEGQAWALSDTGPAECVYLRAARACSLRLGPCRAAKLVLEACAATRAQLAAGCVLMAGTAELIACEACELSADPAVDAPTLLLDRCSACTLRLGPAWLPDRAHRVITTHCRGTTVVWSDASGTETTYAVPDDGDEGGGHVTRRTGPGGAFETEGLVWDGAGYPTTQRDKDEADARDARNALLLENALRSVIHAVDAARALQQQQQQQQQQPQQLGRAREEDVQELHDSDEDVQRAATRTAEMLRGAEHAVAYTGAGISTSAQIPDYRGPRGVWTLRDRGEAPDRGLQPSLAAPTVAHRALAELVRRGLVQHVVSTNVDGLHARSGVPASRLSELHGNCLQERCRACGALYDAPSASGTSDALASEGSATGRTCAKCGAQLYSNVVGFGESLPEGPLATALEQSRRADVALVLGSSLTVRPAADLPLMAPRVVLCNLQRTGVDRGCAVRVFAETDRFMQLVMDCLGIAIPQGSE